MPFIVLSPETKRRYHQSGRRQFWTAELPSGLVYVKPHVYDKLLDAASTLRLMTIDATVNKLLTYAQEGNVK